MYSRPFDSGVPSKELGVAKRQRNLMWTQSDSISHNKIPHDFWKQPYHMLMYTYTYMYTGMCIYIHAMHVLSLWSYQLYTCLVSTPKPFKAGLNPFRRTANFQKLPTEQQAMTYTHTYPHELPSMLLIVYAHVKTGHGIYVGTKEQGI